MRSWAIIVVLGVGSVAGLATQTTLRVPARTVLTPVQEGVLWDQMEEALVPQPTDASSPGDIPAESFFVVKHDGHYRAVIVECSGDCEQPACGASFRPGCSRHRVRQRRRSLRVARERGRERRVSRRSCEDSVDVYERNIAPLLTDARATSCNECHLAGVDLEMYVLGSPCQTTACMVHEGIVDLDDPNASVVLSWIGRAQLQELITEETI